MTDISIIKLQYPIGTFSCPELITEEHIKNWIKDLESLPKMLTGVVQKLSEEQLETPYRPGGWTVRQLVHHIADSHHHSYTRFKWALTESTPVIKAYEEKDWSALFDAKTAPIQLSLDYLNALHAKLVFLLKGLPASDFKKKYIHPDGSIEVTVAENIGKYAWHGNHHLAHIKGLVERSGW
tara:strand:- start:3887 stop:4429 length:543 start_codon:yes stop_codon:yes gene_type:complete